MCAVTRELLVPVGELRYIRVGCQHCNTKVTVDLHEVSSFAVGVTERCPGCKKNYDLSIPSAIGMFRDACKTSAGVLQLMDFMVSPPE
jgi:hypothetical protein